MHLWLPSGQRKSTPPPCRFDHHTLGSLDCLQFFRRKGGFPELREDVSDADSRRFDVSPNALSTRSH
eukprot:3469188-Pyramimonas_sp.AAC.1